MEGREGEGMGGQGREWEGKGRKNEGGERKGEGEKNKNPPSDRSGYGPALKYPIYAVITNLLFKMLRASSSNSLLAEMRTETQRYNTHCCQK